MRQNMTLATIFSALIALGIGASAEATTIEITNHSGTELTLVTKAFEIMPAPRPTWSTGIWSAYPPAKLNAGETATATADLPPNAQTLVAFSMNVTYAAKGDPHSWVSVGTGGDLFHLTFDEHGRLNVYGWHEESGIKALIT